MRGKLLHDSCQLPNDVFLQSHVVLGAVTRALSMGNASVLASLAHDAQLNVRQM